MALGVWGGYILDDEIRRKSSSGGIFSALAIKVIQEGGFVFGATLVKTTEGEFACKHIKCGSVEDLKQIRGSKYLPSNLDTIFIEIEQTLNCGNKVLFCGTPCQVVGLLTYLKKDYENLYTIDFICHGVPNTHIIDKVKQELEQEYDEKVINIDFREKSQGWENYSFVAELESGRTVATPGMKSKYMRLYLSDLYLKESCYSCQFKGLERKCDITLGDFWGVQEFINASEDELFKGISIMVVYSQKGKALMESVRDSVYLYEVEVSIFDSTNIYINQRPIKPLDKRLYEKRLHILSLDEILESYHKTIAIRKVIDRIRKKCSKLILRGKCEESKRKKVLPKKKNCYGCMACVCACPFDAITIIRDEAGFQYPHVDESKCRKCNKCFSACPHINVKSTCFSPSNLP